MAEKMSAEERKVNYPCSVDDIDVEKIIAGNPDALKGKNMTWILFGTGGWLNTRTWGGRD